MEQKNMKPISIAYAEFVNNLTSLINSSMLPPLMIEAVLRDVYREVSAASKRQLERDMEQYQQATDPPTPETEASDE